MKKCSTCKLELSLDAFNKNKAKKDGLASMCRECWKVYYRENYYLRGKEKNRLAEKRTADREKIREVIHAAKDVPCMDCQVKYPYYVMDFDHRDPSQKDFTIAQKVTSKSLALIIKEIAKCDVVCANCHRIRTHG